MSYIGIDYGEKRVGIAVSDEQNRVAFPVSVVPQKQALEEVLRLVKEKQAEGVVVGESRNYAGAENVIMKRVHEFVASLQASGVNRVVLEPEFLTSAQAERSGVSKEKLDASAAAIILQSFLDRGEKGGSMFHMEEKKEEAAVPAQPAPETVGVLPLVNIDTFKKLQIRIGEIRSAEKVPDTDKLLRLSVFFGDEERQIVSGIAGYFPDPSLLVGKRVAFAYNLEPRVIRGLESRGMILAATGADDSFSLLETNGVQPGSFVR